jgi:uncharacterized protein YjbI with pentapeptide repeats
VEKKEIRINRWGQSLADILVNREHKDLIKYSENLVTAKNIRFVFGYNHESRFHQLNDRLKTEFRFDSCEFVYENDTPFAIKARIFSNCSISFLNECKLEQLDFGYQNKTHFVINNFEVKQFRFDWSTGLKIRGGKIGRMDIKDLDVGKLTFRQLSIEDLSISNSTFQECKLLDLKSLNVQIKNNSIVSGLINGCSGKQVNLKNLGNVSSFCISDNQIRHLEIQDQIVDQFSFQENNHHLTFHNCSGYFPDITDNQYELVQIEKTDGFENVDILSAFEGVKAIKLNNVNSACLNVELTNLESFEISDSDLLMHSRVSLTNSKELKITSSSAKVLTIHGTINNVQIHDNSEIKNLFLDNTSSDYVKIEHNFSKQQSLNLKELKSSRVDIIQSKYQSVRFLGCKSPFLRIGSAFAEDYTNWNLCENEISLLRIEDQCEFDTVHFLCDRESWLIAETITTLKSSIGTLKMSNVPSPLLKIEDCRIGNAIITGQGNNHSEIPADILFISCKLDNVDLKSLHAKEISFQESLPAKFKVHDKSSFASLNINQGKECKRFTVQNSYCNSLSINEVDIYNFQLNRTNYSSFLMSNSSLIHLSLYDMRQKDNFELSFINTDRNIKAKKLSIHNSNLGETQFNSCYFDSFEEMSVKSSKLDKIHCTTTLWPKKVTSHDEQGKNDYFEVREACRQLKLAMADHQDRVSELQFHSLEMEAYSKIVNKDWKFWENFNDRLSLLASQTNRFGLNWILPLVLVVFVNIAFYYFALKFHWNNPWIFNHFKCGNMHEFLYLFNPVHKTKEAFPGESISWQVALLDFFSRIFTAFFLYQIVAAFRKYRK